MLKRGKILTPFPGTLLKGSRVIIPKSAWIVSILLHFIALITIIISAIFPLHFSIFGSSKKYKTVKVDLKKNTHNLNQGIFPNNKINDNVSGIDEIIDSSTVYFDGNNYSLKNPSFLSVTFVNILSQSDRAQISRDNTICSNIMPLYPEEARPYMLKADVVLDVIVSDRGDPILVSIKESSGYQIFDQAACETVKRWVFLPAVKKGIPVEDNIRIKFRFNPDVKYAESL